MILLLQYVYAMARTSGLVFAELPTMDLGLEQFVDFLKGAPFEFGSGQDAEESGEINLPPQRSSQSWGPGWDRFWQAGKGLKK